MSPIPKSSRSVFCLSLVLAFCGAALLFPTGLQAQQGAVVRKIMERTTPMYPALARSMALQGSVKVEALVEPDGTVKNVEIKGGHPVLAQAAVNTVRRWRWEPAAHESREIVELKFAPSE
jgi:TonB family protein